jgi:hypothetical protein
MLHITIIKNGETKIDMDTKGIIAAIDDGDTTKGINVIENLSGGDALALLSTLDEAKNNLINAHPALKLLTILQHLEEKPDKTESKPDRVAELLAEALDDKN